MMQPLSRPATTFKLVHARRRRAELLSRSQAQKLFEATGTYATDFVSIGVDGQKYGAGKVLG